MKVSELRYSFVLKSFLLLSVKQDYSFFVGVQ